MKGFYKLYAQDQGQGVQSDSSKYARVYAYGLYLSDWKWKCILFSALYVFHSTFWILNFYLQWQKLAHFRQLWKLDNPNHFAYIQFFAKWSILPVGNYMSKVNYRNTRTRCEICSKLTVKTPERRLASFWYLNINFEHISHLVLVFLLLPFSK